MTGLFEGPVQIPIPRDEPSHKGPLQFESRYTPCGKRLDIIFFLGILVSAAAPLISTLLHSMRGAENAQAIIKNIRTEQVA